MVEISSGQLAKLFDLPKPTIRHYVDEGLLTPKINESNGYQQFVERDIYKLYQIVFLRNIGFSIEVIKDMLKSDSVLPELKGSVASIDDEINKLKAIKNTVVAIIEETDDIKLNEIQFIEKENRMLQKLPQTIVKNGAVDLLEAYELGYSHLDTFFFILDDNLIETVYGFSEKGSEDKVLPKGTYACKNVEYLNDTQLEKEIASFLQDPLLEISQGNEMVIYENIYASLGFSDKQLVTLEVAL